MWPLFKHLLDLVRAIIHVYQASIHVQYHHWLPVYLVLGMILGYFWLRFRWRHIINQCRLYTFFLSPLS